MQFTGLQFPTILKLHFITDVFLESFWKFSEHTFLSHMNVSWRLSTLDGFIIIWIMSLNVTDKWSWLLIICDTYQGFEISVWVTAILQRIHCVNDWIRGKVINHSLKFSVGLLREDVNTLLDISANLWNPQYK